MLLANLPVLALGWMGWRMLDQNQMPLRVHPSGRLLVYTGRGTAGGTEIPASRTFC